MKTLLLVRHAKSSWSSDVSTDFERPLNNRGMKDAPKMAARLQLHGAIPDNTISSTATRALATTRLLMNGLALDSATLTTTDDIYEALVKDLLHTIATINSRSQVAMIVGHNPGMSATGNYLCQNSDLQMPTCAVACFDLDIDHWSDVYRDCAKLRWYDYPRNGE